MKGSLHLHSIWRVQAIFDRERLFKHYFLDSFNINVSFGHILPTLGYSFLTIESHSHSLLKSAQLNYRKNGV